MTKKEIIETLDYKEEKQANRYRCRLEQTHTIHNIWSISMGFSLVVSRGQAKTTATVIRFLSHCRLIQRFLFRILLFKTFLFFFRLNCSGNRFGCVLYHCYCKTLYTYYTVLLRIKVEAGEMKWEGGGGVVAVWE